MGSEVHQLHIFFFPFMAHGHMLPLVDTAKVFASRGVKATVVLTPFNATIFEKSINRAKAAGHPIEIQLLEFPSGTGLPEGKENLDYVTSPDLVELFFRTTTRMLVKPFHDLVQQHLPDCIISDIFFPWTVDVAKSFGIPRLIFNGSSYFAHSMYDCMWRYKPQEKVMSDSEKFVMPGLPDRIELTKSQFADPAKTRSEFMTYLWERIAEADRQSYGLVMNSFYELEPAYVEHCKKETGKKAWHVGPVSLCNRKAVEMAERGKESSINGKDCLRWLDTKEPNSVLYICFGSLCKFPLRQHMETAAALEAADCSFIWVTKNSEILPEGFEEKTKEKGLVIRDWAPQVLILNHPAVGGFMTHCGWNSILEGVCSGLPMITWPVFAEQFFNEKLITVVLKIGVGVGAEKWVSWEEESDVVIKREAIEKAVRNVMGGGGEAEEMREKVGELGEKARRAVEIGGSSYEDLGLLIEELRTLRAK